MPEANPVAVDLLEQIKITLELFKNTENITFRIDWPHEKRFLSMPIKNILTVYFPISSKNSIQSIPSGKEGIIKVSLEKQGGKVIVAVSDNGSGIPESLQKKMFTPNFTTKSSGTGLGLSIVKRYVENAGGRIWFESESDKGSVFFIEFPFMEPQDKSGNQ